MGIKWIPEGEWDPEEWETAKRVFEEELDARYGSAWRDWSQEEFDRAWRNFTDSIPGEIAQIEQDTALDHEAVAFANAVQEKFAAAKDQTGEFPLPREVWEPLFIATIEERYGGWTTLAVSVCRRLNMEPVGYTPKEDRVFPEE